MRSGSAAALYRCVPKSGCSYSCEHPFTGVVTHLVTPSVAGPDVASATRAWCPGGLALAVLSSAGGIGRPFHRLDGDDPVTWSVATRRMLAGAVPSAPTRRTDAPGTCNLHSPTPHAWLTRLLGRRPSLKQTWPRDGLFHVFHLGAPPTLCSSVHSITAEPLVRKGKSGCSLLPWPAWWPFPTSCAPFSGVWLPCSPRTDWVLGEGFTEHPVQHTDACVDRRNLHNRGGEILR